MKHQDLKIQVTPADITAAGTTEDLNNPITPALARTLNLPTEEVYVDEDIVLIQDEVLNIAIEPPDDLRNYILDHKNGKEVMPAEFTISLPSLV